MRFQGRVAIVTGAAQGIGAGIALRLLDEGASVVGLDREEPLEEPLRARIAAGAAVAWHVGDVTDARAGAAAVALAEARFGGLDALVSNAGVNANHDAATMDEAAWDAFMAVDLKAAWLVARAALPALRRRGGGAIVLVSSIQATQTLPGWFPYAAAKAGLLGLARSLALDVGPDGIRVNAITPGYIRTRLTDEHLRREGAAALDRVLALHPLRRIGTPADVGALVAFLASDDGAFCTGGVYPLDGGLSAVLPQ